MQGRGFGSYDFLWLGIGFFPLLMLSHAQSALLAAIEDLVQWCEEYRDDAAVIFSRCEEK